MAGNANFAVWNRLAKVNPALNYAAFILDKGNTRFRGNTGGTSSMTSTHSMSSGKWYIEVYAENNAVSGWPTLGICKTFSISITQNISNYQYASSDTNNKSEVVGSSGEIVKFGAGAASGGVSWANTDILQIAVDIDAGKWWFGKNNTWAGSGDPANGNNPIDTFTSGTEMSVWTASYSGASYMHINAGQDDTFNGNVTAAGNADGNGYGAFKYSPPASFLALCSANLPISDDIDPAQTDSNYIGGKHFSAVEYTGSGGAQTISGLGIKPDLLWCKMTSSSQNNQLFDSSRLNTRSTPFMLRTDSAAAELDDQSTGNNNKFISAFNDDGFVFGASGSGPNDSSRTYIAMGWKANAGTTSTNNVGNTATTVQANTDAGFSIVTWTGTGTNSRTLGTGLTKQPEMVWVKNRDSGSYAFFVYHHKAKAGGQPNDYGVLTLNSVNAYSEGSGALTYWDISEWSNSVFSVGGDGGVNGNNNKMLAYCWHGVEGFSKFGHYYGVGNTDGTFVYTGFRPKFVIVKKVSEASTTYGWPAFLDIVNDNANDATFNNWWVDQTVAAGGNYGLDFVSNGFKHRNNNANLDASGKGYIYAAWGAVPFKYNNQF